MAEAKIEEGTELKMGRGPGPYRLSESTLTFDRCSEFRCRLLCLLS